LAAWPARSTPTTAAGTLERYNAGSQPVCALRQIVTGTGQRAALVPGLAAGPGG
jgi:hypothetical protein